MSRRAALVAGSALGALVLLAATLAVVSEVRGGQPSGDSAASPTTPASAPPGGVHTLAVDGRIRSYLLHVPPGTDPRAPAPLLVALHPGYGTGAGFARTTGFDARADEAGYVVAYPDGLSRSWNAGDCCGPPAREGVDDVGFLLAVVDDVAGRVPVDRRNVFVAGFSNGAGLAYLLACRRAERVRAIVVGGSPLHVPPETCTPSRPVPVLAFHGLADPVAPFDGGTGILAHIGQQQPVQATIERWRAIDRCGPDVRTVEEHGGARVVTSSGCAPGTEVTLCTVKGMGHQWPGGAPYDEQVFGPQSSDVSATDMAMAFFERHRDRGPGAPPASGS